MTTRDALLRAILDQPDEDTPRLAYADYLGEFGDEGDRARAEFIRVQVELARLRDCQYKLSPIEYHFVDGTVGYEDGLDCGRCERCRKMIELRSREQELFDESWFNPDGAIFNTVNWHIDDYMADRLCAAPRRGFLEYVRGPSSSWLTHADAIRAAHPVVDVTLTDWPDWVGCIRFDRSSGTFCRAAELWRDRPYFTSPDLITPGEAVAACLSMRWPGITFHLPPQPVPYQMPPDGWRVRSENDASVLPEVGPETTIELRWFFDPDQPPA